MDIGEIVKQFKLWKETFPKIHPFYAVKCNDTPVVLKVLAALGTSFDCASKGEIAKILSLGIPAERIIFANPVKQASHIRYAAKVGVDLMTFDNPTELYKIKELHPFARLVLRLAADSLDSQCPAMGLKFGANPGKAMELVKLAHTLDLNIVGVSFHVGSGCREHQAYRRALRAAKELHDYCKSVGFNMEIIDIGGGFTNDNFEKAATSILGAIEEYFPWENVKFISEPGRFFVSNAYTLAAKIHSMRVDKSKPMYYINDGLYGSFNCLLYDKAIINPIPLKNHYGPLYKSTIWGPTCDSLDLICEDYPLPKMSLGDWIIFENMGAYSIPTSTSFNGFEPPKIHHLSSNETWNILKSSLPELFTEEEKPYWSIGAKEITD